MLSVVTVTYNAENTLEDNLSSICRQSVTPEHIIVDGASTDSTLEIIATTEHSPSQVISEPDRGIYDAMNKGIALVNGSIIGFLNADDIYASDNIIKTVENAFEDKSVDACYGDLCYVDFEDTSTIVRYWKAGQYSLQSFHRGWMPPHPTFFVRKEIYEHYGVFNLTLGSAADYELMLRFLMKYRVKAKYIPDILVKMRVGGVSSKSIKNRFLANRNDKRAWKINGLKPCPWTFFLKPIRKVPQWFVR